MILIPDTKFRRWLRRMAEDRPVVLGILGPFIIFGIFGPALIAAELLSLSENAKTWLLSILALIFARVFFGLIYLASGVWMKLFDFIPMYARASARIINLSRKILGAKIDR